MNSKIWHKLGHGCAYSDCSFYGRDSTSPESRHFVRCGYYRRQSDSVTVSRFKCLGCKRSYSSSRFTPTFRQKLRQLNNKIFILSVSNTSQRRIARILGISQKTVAQKLIFMGQIAQCENELSLKEYVEKNGLIRFVNFDEMQTSEITKCKPLSIPLLVVSNDPTSQPKMAPSGEMIPERRRILAFGVAPMPATGPLAKIAVKKYGPREDKRAEVAETLWESVKPYLAPSVTVTTDMKSDYRNWIAPHFPDFKHIPVKGRRGCVVGQGELKKAGFDPLFDLNHTAAMLRANICRLNRRTWCTTKKKERLALHIALYVKYHNEVLLKKGASEKRRKARSETSGAVVSNGQKK